jgi:magnesium transporter
MLKNYYKSIRDEDFHQIEDFRVGSWIHVDQANISDLEKVIELTGLEMADLQDSLDRHEIPRIEHKDKNTIIFVRHTSEDEKVLHTATLAIIITPQFLITISPQKCPFVDFLTSHKTRIATTQRSKLLFMILLKITQDFTFKIKRVIQLVSEQEQRMRKVDSNTIVELAQNEESLNQYLSTLVPMKNVLESISLGKYVGLYEKDKEILHDLQNAIKQSEDLCRVNVKSIRSLRDSYQSIFTNDVNKTMKFLTAITIIFTIPTIIASIYGMNVKLPLEGNPYAFLIILNISAVIMLASIWIFAKKKWL